VVNLFLWLISAVGPLAKKVLVALGIGWLSYAGVSTAVNLVRDQILSQWGAIPATTANILALFGFGESLGIVLGALAARAALAAAKKLGALVE
jgi:hypothetical protein